MREQLANLKKLYEQTRKDTDKLLEEGTNEMGYLTISYKGTSAKIPIDYPESNEWSEVYLQYLIETLEDMIEDYLD